MNLAGYTALQMRHAGFGAKEMKFAGVGASELKRVGYSLTELRNAGVAARTGREACRHFSNCGLQDVPNYDGGLARFAPCTDFRHMTPRIRYFADMEKGRLKDMRYQERVGKRQHRLTITRMASTGIPGAPSLPHVPMSAPNSPTRVGSQGHLSRLVGHRTTNINLGPDYGADKRCASAPAGSGPL